MFRCGRDAASCGKGSLQDVVATRGERCIPSVDFIVHYPDDYDYGPWLARYFEFRDRLQTLLGRPVELVMASAIRKPRFIQAAKETRQVMLDAPASALMG